MTDVKLGANLWSQASDWPGFLSAAQRAEALGFDSFWTWDHLLAIFGDPHQPIFEGYTALAAVAQATERDPAWTVRRRQPVPQPRPRRQSPSRRSTTSAAAARSWASAAPGSSSSIARSASTSASGFGQRLDWLGEALDAASRLIDGETVTSPPGGRYAFDDLRIDPPPVQSHLPIMIGGSGEQKTLRLVARYADMWNAFGSPETLAHKDAVLRERCEEVGRDPDDDRADRRLQARRSGARRRRPSGCVAGCSSTTARRSSDVAGDETFWTGTPEQIAETMAGYRKIGFHTFIVELPAPV